MESQVQLNEVNRRVEAEDIKRLTSDRYLAYVPIGKVEQFINEVDKRRTMVNLLSGANGIGKTTSIANVAANLCWPSDNPFFQQDLFQKYPYDLKRMRIMSKADTLQETLIPEMKYWFPKNRYKIDKKGRTYDYEWTTDTGWRINILTYDQDPSSHESGNVSITLADEPMPFALYSANVSRFRRGGMLIIFATLLEGAAWIVPEIINDKTGDCFHMFINAEDACKEHGVRGHLEHSQIIRQYEKYSPEERTARIWGKPMSYAGLVFKEFSEQVHVIQPFDINSEDFVVWHSLDTHLSTNEAGVWVAIGKDGNYYVVDELWGKWGTSELINNIKRRNAMYRMGKLLIEPAAFDEDLKKSKELGRTVSFATDLMDKGLNYVPASKLRHLAVSKTKDAFRFQVQGDLFIHKPKLFIFNTCVNLIEEIKNWNYMPQSKKVLEYREKYQKFVDKDDHLIEALGRIIVEDPKFSLPDKVMQEMVRDHNYDPYKRN